MAPTKVLLVPLSNKEEFRPILSKIDDQLSEMGISSRTDDSSSSIGKRYARNDELGTAFGITVDFQTIQDGSITLRERDSTKQVRASQADILQAIQSICKGSETWTDVAARLPEFASQEVEAT